MSKALKLSEVIQPEFRTSEGASKKNEVLAKNLDTNRYGPARLALALSLADKRPVKTQISDTKGDAIRGRTLFGDDANIATWIALDYATRRARTGQASVHRRGRRTLGKRHQHPFQNVGRRRR